MEDYVDPTPEEQQEFWRLFGAVAKAQSTLRTAEKELERFGQEHRGKSFRAFPPELIRQAMSHDVEIIDIGDFEE